MQELFQNKSKHHRTKAHAPLLVESFPKTPRTQSEASWFSGSHNYKTKQNKTNHLASWIDDGNCGQKLYIHINYLDINL
jgi:hypothetical protein